MAKRIKQGDIFKFRVGDSSFGIGQIVRKYKYLIYIIVFEPRYEDLNSFSIEAVEQLEIVLIGKTNGAMLKMKGFWEVVGNHHVIEERLLFPNHKVQTLQGFMKTDFEGNLIGKASE
jgi:hypothetical protein